MVFVLKEFFSRIVVLSLVLGVLSWADDNKKDPLFASVPQESDRDLVVEVADWGWVGALMRRGRVRIHQKELSRFAGHLGATARKGTTNREIKGGVTGVVRSSRGTMGGILAAVQNIVILMDVAGKVYIWNSVDGAPVPIPEDDVLYTQIHEALNVLPASVERTVVDSTHFSETRDEYLGEFERHAHR